jgi:hypothetical protein
MVKAVVSRGEIRPIEPLPVDWQEGLHLQVEKAEDCEVPADEIDRDFAVLASLCATNDPSDEEQLERALQEARQQAKDQVRRQMGLACCRTTCSIATIYPRRCTGYLRCASEFTRAVRPGIASFPATPFFVSWKSPR